MILDSSALIALLVVEPDYRRIRDALESADAAAIGAPTLFEASIVAVARFGEDGIHLVGQLVSDWEVEISPFGAAHWRAATDAFLRYGKGRHPARLNLGDCLTYAVARVADRPLLFTGNDFAKTDIAPA